MKKYAIGIALLGVVSACTEMRQTSNGEQTAASVAIRRSVAPPFAKAAPQFQKFRIQASKAEQIRLENGTIIAIPAGAFVDLDGKPVSGNVDIAYREFRNAADILLSGIPMAYDSAGQSHLFQSAGMMEIRASQNNQPLEVAAGKSLEVAMMSAVSGSFNNYYFDEKKGAWGYLSTNSPSSTLAPDAGNRPKPAATAAPTAAAAEGLPEQEALTQPVAPPDVADPAALQFNFTVDYSELKHLAPYKNVTWQYAAGDEPGTINPEKNRWIFRKVWSYVSIDKAVNTPNAYVLSLSEGKKTTRVLAKPVLSEVAHAAAMEEYAANQRAYEKWRKRLAAKGLTPESFAAPHAERVAERERGMTVEQRVQRAFSVAQMGIYNCDRILHTAESQQLVVGVELQNAAGEPIANKDIAGFFLVNRSIQGAFYYTPGTDFMQWGQFVYAANHQNLVVAIDTNGEIFICRHNDFHQLTQAHVGKGLMKLVLQDMGKQVTSSEMLQQIIMG